MTRATIRNELKQMLLGNTQCSSNVFSNRIDAYWKEQLPAISIYTTQESAEKRDVSGRSYIRTMQLSIEITAEIKQDSAKSIDDFLDDVADEVEVVISQDQSINGTCLASELIGTEIEMSGEPASPIGVATLNYEIKYIK